MIKHANIRKHTRGISIVEALVALLILSVGMLGIAALYLESVRANRTALARTSAVQLINDMADRIRANRNALGNYTLVAGTAPGAAPVDCATTTAKCTPAQTARFDINRWHASVLARLPKGPGGTTNPRAAVTFVNATATVPARYMIEAQWVEPGDTAFLTSSIEVQL
jgi:type IV pilus assembly protein PilV